jgi:transcriptional regulatory protein GAL4
MLEVGNLTLMQSLTLISNYLQKRDRPNSSYNCLGLAVRMAFGLGLHKDFPQWKSNPLHEEIRRRTWWCLYIFDVGSTITFGRPLAIPSAGIDAKLPLNTFDSNLTASSVGIAENADTPTIYTNVRVQSQFHLLTTSLYNRIISKPFPSAQQVLLWDDLYIGKWLKLVPEYYREDAAVPERHILPHSIMT